MPQAPLEYFRGTIPYPINQHNLFVFGSDRSPRRGNVCCVSVCLCVRVIMLRMTLKEFLMHSKEYKRVLSKQASMQASRQGSRQGSKQASRQTPRPASTPASKQVGKQAGK